LRSAIITLAPAPERLRDAGADVLGAAGDDHAVAVHAEFREGVEAHVVPLFCDALARGGQSSSCTPPPETVSTCPLIQDEAGAHRNSAA
jgi:hypothetical protein